MIFDAVTVFNDTAISFFDSLSLKVEFVVHNILNNMRPSC
jgi:hypothetical protein